MTLNKPQYKQCQELHSQGLTLHGVRDAITKRDGSWQENEFDCDCPCHCPDPVSGEYKNKPMRIKIGAEIAVMVGVVILIVMLVQKAQ